MQLCMFSLFNIASSSQSNSRRIMLIDLYERPYSPEAPKSRAFIDKIFSLTGPDGGVVGGEDGITTARPLKDGGREAWDMIRRLRQKAWQKAGLNPQQLWTEYAQIQAGVASVSEDYRDRSDPYYHYPLKATYDNASSRNGGSSSLAPPSQVPTQRPVLDRQFADFSKTFFNMTRAHMLPNPTPMRPSPLRYAYPLPPAPTSASGTPPLRLPTPQYTYSPTAGNDKNIETTTNTNTNGSTTRPLDITLPASMVSSPESIGPFHPTIPLTQQPALTTSPSGLPSFMDTSFSTPTASPNGQGMMAVPTLPSLMDPSLNFDWDQWDAVFGHHLPIPEELMESDPVSGFENISSPPAPRKSPPGLPVPMPCDWEGYC